MDISINTRVCLSTCTIQIDLNYVESFFSQKPKVVTTCVSFLEHQELHYLDQYCMRYGPNTETRWAGLEMHISHVVPQI